jgi:cytochrome c oxidase cbb3-type subunit IV
MIQNILCSISGVGIYGVVSICLFFAFFTGVLVWTGTLKKNYLKAMGDLPLNDGSLPHDASEKNQS